eukprot:6207925-Pleurochrysis_carterae.AAC.1
MRGKSCARQVYSPGGQSGRGQASAPPAALRRRPSCTRRRSWRARSCSNGPNALKCLLPQTEAHSLTAHTLAMVMLRSEILAGQLKMKCNGFLGIGPIKYDFSQARRAHTPPPNCLCMAS